LNYETEIRDPSVFAVRPPAVVIGAAPILQWQPQLAELAGRCGQDGAADYVRFFLTQPYNGGKIPMLLLFWSDRARRGSDASRILEGAVVVHQVQRLGVRLPIYVTEDQSGERNILGAPSERSALAIRAARFLVETRGAWLVLLTLNDGQFVLRPASPPGAKAAWGLVTRELRRYLSLQSTYEETLGCFGAHTRRNLRYERRRAESQLGCEFIPEASLTEDEFVELNRRSHYPVPHRVALWRFRSVRTEPGAVLAGVRCSDGRWLSLLGGRRHHGTLAVDWQVNCSDWAAYSPSTLIRGYLIEHEVQLGTQRILFEGGTQQSIRSAFTQEVVTDMIAARRGWAVWASRLSRSVRGKKMFLASTLSSPTLQWHDEVITGVLGESDQALGAL
jgi:hypothetical protein